MKNLLSHSKVLAQFTNCMDMRTDSMVLSNISSRMKVWFRVWYKVVYHKDLF